jgi:hypothetical protein
MSGQSLWNPARGLDMSGLGAEHVWPESLEPNY